LLRKHGKLICRERLFADVLYIGYKLGVSHLLPLTPSAHEQ
jgi:hypothetical protein